MENATLVSIAIGQIVCQYPDANYTLNILEPYFIKMFRSSERKFGYNMNSGGGRPKHNLEAILKNSLAHKGKIPWNKGKVGYKHSEETKKKMSEIRRGKKRNFKPEFYENLRNRNIQQYTGKPLSEEHKAKMKAAQQARRAREAAGLIIPGRIKNYNLPVT